MSTMTATTAPAITIRREFAIPAGELFDAWLDPELLAVWMRPGGNANSIVQVDARVGGRFDIRMQTPSGEIPHHGTYVKIDRPRQLVFTWFSRHTLEQESLVTVDFIARGKSTEIVVTHERLPDAEAAAKHTAGWTTILERLGGGGGNAQSCS
ncbi:MAG: SRPBCC domain-containing protein [Proteobacteria bacterium]|nr:SRPBCC domain-containing protein [Pseudomonadota bacterium]